MLKVSRTDTEKIKIKMLRYICRILVYGFSDYNLDRLQMMQNKLFN